MLTRPIVMTGLLGAAVAAPIAVTEGPKHLESLNFGGPTASPTAGAPPAGTIAPPPGLEAALRPPTIEALQGPEGAIYPNQLPLEGLGFASPEQLLRMDVTQQWVYSHWARKSTGLAEPGLFGVRVPVVTGTMTTDLAGSLSYYFNNQGLCDKLRFHGRTGDTRQLVAIAQQQYGMRPAAGLSGEQLYQSTMDYKVLCELRIRPEAVVWDSSRHDQYLVDLELNRPGSGHFVEQRLLKPDIPAPEQPPQTAEAAKPAPTEAAAEATTETSEIKNAQKPMFRWPN